MKKLVIASGNVKKRREIEQLLGQAECQVLTLKDFPGCPEVEETGKTFADNAALKALAVAEYTGLPALADDSGLEVDALGGEPGVKSARYASASGDENASDEANTALLLEKLKSVPEKSRGARFVCAMVLAVPDSEKGARQTAESHGTVEGRIAFEPAGSQGFGYDPVFIPEGHEQTFGQLGAEIKHGISHRKKALEGIQSAVKETLERE